MAIFYYKIRQAQDGILEKNRDREQILSNLKPGYLGQNSFTSRYTPQAILLSIGGNNPSDQSGDDADFPGFSTVLSTCVLSTHSTCYSSATDRHRLLSGIYSLFDELVTTYQRIKIASPATRVYAVGYPQVIKPGGDCAVNVHLDNNEALFAQQLIARLDKTIKMAAEKAGVFYVDTQTALDGYRLCENKYPAINGLTAGNDNYHIIGKESYHPTALGHDLLADHIARQTAHLTTNMPAPNPAVSKPTIDPTDPFLIDPLQRQYDEYIRKNNPDMAPDILFRGDSVRVEVDGLSASTELNGQYQAVMHSNPVDLGVVRADANGDISADIIIPATMPSGLHTLHLFGKNFDGRSLDISKQVYVAVSPEDYDGDGVPNSQEPCVIFDASGQDADEDGIDDACDAIIGEAPVAVSGTTSQANSPNNIGSQKIAVVPVDSDTSQLQSSSAASPQESVNQTDLGHPQVQGVATTNGFSDTPAQTVARQSKNHFAWLGVTIIVLVALGLAAAKYRQQPKD